MYRPTVRYSDAYKEHINDLFHETTLDRNQILRLVLHVAAHSEQFKRILGRYKKGDVPLSSPAWRLDSHGLWMENSETEIEGGKYVNGIQQEESQETRVSISRTEEEQHRRKLQSEGRKRQIPTTTIRNQGGITLRL